MNRLLEIQPLSKATQFCKIIRESDELSKNEFFSENEDLEFDNKKEDLEKSDENENDEDYDYEALKNDVLKILRRKIDEKCY